MFLPPPKQPNLSISPHGPGSATRSLHDRIIETLRYISDEVDPRHVGGFGEAQAAGYVAGRLRRADYAAAVQSFRAGRGERGPLALVAVLGGVSGGLVAGGVPLAAAVALVVVVLAVVLLLAEIEGGQPLRGLVRGKTSQSVVAGRAASAKQVRQRVIVLAPLDGSPQAILGRRALLVLLGALILESICIGGVLVTGDWMWRIAVALCAAVLLLLFALVVLRRPGPAVLPAIHGAGELATLLMIAEELETLEGIEVWVIALGGGSVGHESIHALLERYPFSPADTAVINLHNINSGQPVFVTREGVLRDRRSDRALLALAADADAADMLIDAEPRRLRERTLAHTLFRHDFRTITISSHSHASPFTSPEADTIERCVRLVVGMIRALGQNQAKPLF